MNFSIEDLTRFDLSGDYSTETAVVFGEIYRHQCGWKFRAVGQGYAGTTRLCLQHGVDVTNKIPSTQTAQKLRNQLIN